MPPGLVGSMADVTLVAILVAIAVGEVPTVLYALATPLSTPRELVALVLTTALGVIFLIVQGVSPLDPSGVGLIAYLGASTLGIGLVSGATKISTMLPHAPATGGSGPPR